MNISLFFITYHFVTALLICCYCVNLAEKHSLLFRISFSFILYVSNIVFYNYISLINVVHPMSHLFLFFLLFVYFVFFSNYKIQEKLLFATTPCIILTFINISTDIVIKLFSINTVIINYSVYVFSFLLKAMFFILIITYIKKEHKEVDLYDDGFSITLISIVILIILCIAEYSENLKLTFNPYIAITILSLILLTVLLLQIQNENNKEKTKREQELHEQELLQSELALNKKYLASQEELHLLKHDVQHILTTISEKGSEITNEELQDKLKRISTLAIPFNTGNTSLDTILNIKKEAAENNDITFICTANIDNNLIINNEDLCLLMINLLDNAIEHIGEDKRIEVTIKKNNSKLLIKVSNSVDNEIPLIGELYKLPKSINNGYGIRTIQKIVTKYNGLLNYSQLENMLTCSISITDPTMN